MYISANKNDDHESLWLRFASGDKSVFGRLYSYYHKNLTAYCIGVISNIEQAENVASDVLIKLLQYDKVEKIENFEAWIFHVAKNECLSYLSKLERRKRLLNDNYKMDLEKDPDIEMTFTVENMDRLIRSNLNEKDYKIWQLHQQGYDNKEIAEIVGSSEKTVANRKSEARIKLKQVFKEINQ